MPFLNLFSRIPFLPLLSSNQYSIRPFFARKRGEFIAFSPDTWILPSARWKRKQSCTGTGSRRNRNRICARARQVKRFRKWRSWCMLGRTCTRCRCIYCSPVRSATNVRIPVSKRRPTPPSAGQVCAYTTGKLSVITGNTGDETSIADCVRCF